MKMGIFTLALVAANIVLIIRGESWQTFALLDGGAVAGYLLGIFVGIDAGAKHALAIFRLIKPVGDAELSAYVSNRIRAHGGAPPTGPTVREELAHDEEYQRQLREQANG